MASIYSENVWSTVVTIESDLDGFSYHEQIKFLHYVDQVFSTFIPDSQVNKLRTGQIHISKTDQLLQEVWLQDGNHGSQFPDEGTGHGALRLRFADHRS